MPKSKQPCKDCRDDFYNQPHNPTGTTECWCLKTAKLVTRYRLPWWTEPTVPGAFTKVETYNCHHEPGVYAFYKTLPECAKNVQGEEERANTVIEKDKGDCGS